MRRCCSNVKTTYVYRLSYGVFFAAFDMTRRAGLRVKALFGGNVQTEWSNFIAYDQHDRGTTATPTRARIAQATTIVAGGVLASLSAEMAGRPFRACQRISQQATAGGQQRIISVLRTQGLRPFLRPDRPASQPDKERGMVRAAKRMGWRMAAVGPWGLGFLVWAWVGGEI